MGARQRPAARVIRVALVVLVAALASADDVPTDRAGCEARGGRWGPAGLLPAPVCNLPTKDGGKPCRDRADCESDCIAELTEAEKKALPVETTGKCAAWRRNPGCRAHVHDGRVESILCVD